VTLGIVFVQTSIFSLGQVVAQGLMQQLVPEDLRGRVFSLIISGHTVIRVLGVAAWGTLIDYIGVIPVFNLAGSVATLAGLFILVNMTHLQTAEDQALARVTADSPVTVESA
jgi:predicted MFS family arabinose efflux permease